MIKFLAGGKALELNKLYQNIAKCHKFKSRPDVDMIKLQESAQRCFDENKKGYLLGYCPFTLEWVWYGQALTFGAPNNHKKLYLGLFGVSEVYLVMSVFVSLTLL